MIADIEPENFGNQNAVCIKSVFSGMCHELKLCLTCECFNSALDFVYATAYRSNNSYFNFSLSQLRFNLCRLAIKTLHFKTIQAIIFEKFKIKNKYLAKVTDTSNYCNRL